MHLLEDLPTPSHPSYQTVPKRANPAQQRAQKSIGSLRVGRRASEAANQNVGDDYNRRMVNVPDSARDFLATGPLAHVVTLDSNGTPHVTLAWAGFDGNDVVWSTFYPDQAKIRHLRHDPRVALSFQAHEHSGEGLHPYLAINGRATFTEGGALEVMDRLAEFYIGHGQKFPLRDGPPGAVIRVTVDRIYGNGPWGKQL